MEIGTTLHAWVRLSIPGRGREERAFEAAVQVRLSVLTSGGWLTEYEIGGDVAGDGSGEGIGADSHTIYFGILTSKGFTS